VKRVPRVWVLLSTFNGGLFLERFLQSLDKQSYASWKILVRDDGSTDNTLEILKSYSCSRPGRLEWYSAGLNAKQSNVGASRSFSLLLDKAKGVSSVDDLYSFADQDDLWVESKLERMVSVYINQPIVLIERPLLIHADLAVIDEGERMLAASLWEEQKTDPKRKELRQLLVQNTVTGCSTLFNHSLLAAATPIPLDAIMHDWWLALIAAGAGAIVSIDEPLVLYRQHAHNVVGSKRYDSAYIIYHALSTIRGESKRQSITDMLRQAEVLVEHNAFKGMGIDSKVSIVEFVKISYAPLPQRLHLLVGSRFSRTGWLRNLGLLVDVLLFKRKG
jgi:glycosyltransferase involved in cell wall biosynthesis